MTDFEIPRYEQVPETKEDRESPIFYLTSISLMKNS